MRALGLVAFVVVVLGSVVVATTRVERLAVPVAKAREQPAVSASALQRGARVILVTLDGARWQDVLDRPGALAGPARAMPKLLEVVAKNGVALPATTSSSVPLSLPGYQALAAGRRTACADNDCGRITHETLAEAVARRLSLPPQQVAVFASWARLAFAASARDGAVTVDVPPRGPPTPGGPPWEDARWDADTASRAVAHLRAHRPRLLHLALLDMDEYAHLGDAPRTVEALRRADDVIATLLEEVRRWGAEERRLTTLIVTADHGRGPGRLWTSHSAYGASRDVFVLAAGDLVRGGSTADVTQADVRPTVERLLGLCPTPGEGRPIDAIAGSLPCG
ncbi:MAG: alkaline phosphatase family protein [Myxococcaceae bacterium]|nr:alkaline phosphatase family protein [Myxococcaceae bacterium]